jgi:chromate reductase, NAD(P)H dehydrogenase (quinone)
MPSEAHSETGSEPVVVGLSGSLRRGSHNTRLLHAAARELPEGASLRIYRDLAGVPPYNEDDDRDPAPAAVARLRAEIGAADALLVATPEYNQSIPGQLKNAVDWASRPFPDSSLRFLPTAVVGASTGAFGAVWAQAEMRKVLAACGARVVEGEVALGHAHERFDAEGNLVDEEAREQLREVMRMLVDAARPRGRGP